MFESLKKQVYEANLLLVKHNLVIFTWGNVSAKSEDGNYVAIKPSGVDYDSMTPDDIVILDLQGNVVEGNLRPSSDTPTHIELYNAFPNIKGVCHTHSSYATSFAQAGMNIDCMGTTHADYFYGAIPCTRSLTEKEIIDNYEKNTGLVIIETFKKYNYEAIPGVLVKNHGCFSWGKSASDSVHNAVVMEEVAKMNYYTKTLNPDSSTLEQYVLDKHYKRKHGKNAYYGQKDSVACCSMN